MNIIIDAHMEDFGEAGYLAWIESPKNLKMAVQAESAESAARELILSLKVQLSRAFGIEMSSIQEKQFMSAGGDENELLNSLKNIGKNELKLQLAS